MRNLKILGVCQGNGTMLYPIKKYVVGNIEPRGCFYSPGNKQWELNFKGIPFTKDIESFISSTSIEKVDIILSSANCGASSILSYSRKKSFGKPKEDKSIKTLIDSIRIFKPKVFVLENLPRLLDLFPIEEWQTLFPKYEFITHCHSVSEFGNSQLSRKRLLLIGIKKKYSSKYRNKLLKVLKVNTTKTTRELLKVSKNMPGINYSEPLDKKVPMYDYRNKDAGNLTLMEIKKLWSTDFKDHYKWPIMSSKMRTLPGVYRNKLDKYPMTVRPSSRQFNPNGSVMGLNDYKAIQGLPESFKIYVDEDNLQYWINKGRITITKGPVYEIGLWFKKALQI